MFRRTSLTVESLSAERTLDKLARENIDVYSAHKSAKNKITFEVATKDLEKVFAILRGSCYNVNKVRFRGLTLLYKKCLGAVGLLVGAALFLGIVLYFQTRVLKIEVVGSGAYYEAQVLSVLEKSGVKILSPQPKETAMLSAEILSLPRVSYCSLKCEGGILTVEVRVTEDHETLEVKPLVSPASGTVEELTVVRGTPRVQVGDTVEKDQIIVDGVATYGEEQRTVIVIARVKIAFSVLEEFSGTEEEARASAYLKYGEINEIHTEKSENGYIISGTAYVEGTMNL